MENKGKMKEIISGAIRVLEENGWTKGVCARNKVGVHIGIEDPEACSFCVMGALLKAQGHAYIQEPSVLTLLSDFIIEKRGFNPKLSVLPLAAYNDGCESKSQVIQLLKDYLISLGD